jgi:hypothetical protein
MAVGFDDLPVEEAGDRPESPPNRLALLAKPLEIGQRLSGRRIFVAGRRWQRLSRNDARKYSMDMPGQSQQERAARSMLRRRDSSPGYGRPIPARHGGRMNRRGVPPSSHCGA